MTSGSPIRVPMSTIEGLLLLFISLIALVLFAWARIHHSARSVTSRPHHLPLTDQPLLNSNIRTLHQTSALSVPDTECWKRLTKREQQVARLAAQGTSDQEIANALHISERTVGNHLAHIYAKLEIHSRHELKYLLPEIGDT